MKRFIYCALGTPVLLSALLTPDTARAALQELDGPDASATVGQESPIYDWNVSDGAQLNVTPGGTVGAVMSLDAVIDFDGATLATDGQGLYLGNSTAIVRNSVLSTTGASLNVNRLSGAQVLDSRIDGIGRAVNVAGEGHVVLSNTQVHGADDGRPGAVGGGIGLALVNGGALIDQGSQIVGDHHGVFVSPDDINGPGMDNHLVVDGSHIEGKTGSAILVSSLISAMPAHASISLSNGATLRGGDGVILEVERGGVVDFSVANSHLAGNIQAAPGTRTDVVLRESASLTGAITGATSLRVEQALWTLTDDSNLQYLTLDAGRVDLGGADGQFHRLELDTLAGSGVFGLGTDLAAGQGDELIVSGHASGSHQLAIQNTGADVAKGQAPLGVVQTGGGDAQFGVIGGQVDLGTFVYDLQQQGNDWFLVQRPGDVVTPGTRSVLGLFSAAPTVWYGESSTLRSPLGELRMGHGEGGVWSRAYGNRYNASAGGDVSYKQTQQGLSVGADGALPVTDGQMLLGVMGGYSRSDLDLASGTTGSVDSYYVGVYGTWLGDSGYYVDALMKLNRFQNESDVRMSDGKRSGGRYTNHGLGASVEAGKRFELDDGVFVSPFAQLSTLWVQGEKYSLDNGMQARSNKADSLLGKVGMQMGQTRALADGGKLDYYTKVAVAHEFANNNEVKVNGNRFTNDLSGTRGELGLGTALQVSDRVQLHADLDFTKGQAIEQPWGVNLGVRYNF